MFTDATSESLPSDVTAYIGISVEPLPQIMQEVATLPSAVARQNANPVADATLMAERIVKNLFNYVSSFVGGGPTAISPDLMIPMSMIAKWYENFITKVRNSGTAFLERQDTE